MGLLETLQEAGKQERASKRERYKVLREWGFDSYTAGRAAMWGVGRLLVLLSEVQRKQATPQEER